MCEWQVSLTILDNPHNFFHLEFLQEASVLYTPCSVSDMYIAIKKVGAVRKSFWLLSGEPGSHWQPSLPSYGHTVACAGANPTWHLCIHTYFNSLKVNYCMFFFPPTKLTLDYLIFTLTFEGRTGPCKECCVFFNIVQKIPFFVYQWNIYLKLVLVSHIIHSYNWYRTQIWLNQF